ncbi:amidohydrolase family protein [SAR202 cluster bacterium AD-804-J14_MRT_500m]|nr:amidohydrolase family protein [SAR202 cluster bacterium AD-804-J14_MRT_500m]
MATDYDLILKGGKVVDPSQGIYGDMDIGFKDGKVKTISRQISAATSEKIIDVTEKLVTPGLIDLHGHFAHLIVPFRAEPDEANLPFGVTTAVDTGSTGWMNFPGFRAYVIEKSTTRILAFLHISAIGSCTVRIGIPDLEDFRLVRTKEAIDCINKNKDIILGTKVRLGPTGTTSSNTINALQKAREIADETETLVMVHVMESDIPLKEVFEYLNPGDIVTHCFHGDTHNVLDENRDIRPEVWNAYNNGIIFDTGCFAKHFSIPICRTVIRNGMPPHTLSTDRIGEDHPVAVKYTLLDVMSMFLEMGMSLQEIIQSVTSSPASVLDRSDLGTLKPGAEGDAAVLNLSDQPRKYPDLLGNEIIGRRNFTAELTVKSGKLWTRT